MLPITSYLSNIRCIYWMNLSLSLSLSLYINNLFNNLDLLCIHIFVYLLSSCCIDFMVSSGNWFMKLPKLIVAVVLSARSWAFIRSVYIAKAMWPLHVRYYFDWVVFIAFILKWYQFNSTTSTNHSCPKSKFRKILTKNPTILK